MSACSSVPENSEPIDVTNVEVYDDHAFDINNVQDVIYAQSKGDVEVYNLDRPLGDDRVVPSPYRGVQPRGTYSPEPSVEIFLLDDVEPAIRPVARPPAPRVVQQAVAPEPIVLGGAEPAFESESAAPGLVTVYFDHGSAKLDAGDLDVVALVAERFDPAQGVGLDVMGHASVDAQVTDPVQRKIANLKESMNRAFSVAKALIERGVPAEAIRVTGWGETRPPRGGASGFDDGQALRRVEILDAVRP